MPLLQWRASFGAMASGKIQGQSGARPLGAEWIKQKKLSYRKESEFECRVPVRLIRQRCPLWQRGLVEPGFRQRGTCCFAMNFHAWRQDSEDRKTGPPAPFRF